MPMIYAGNYDLISGYWRLLVFLLVFLLISPSAYLHGYSIQWYYHERSGDKIIINIAYPYNKFFWANCGRDNLP